MKIVLTISLVIMCSRLSVYAQNTKAYDIVSVEPSEGNYVITYYNNPVGDLPDAEYSVSVRLLRESVSDFDMPMKFVSGDVGDGHYVGSKLKIIWDYKRQFPRGIPYDDMVFELTITKNEGGGSWVYYVGGVAVLGAGAAVLLSKKSTSSGGGSSDIPALTISRPN